LSPQHVLRQQELVTQAHQPSQASPMSWRVFYAQHTGLIKTLGGAALAIGMSKMKDRMTQQPS